MTNALGIGMAAGIGGIVGYMLKGSADKPESTCVEYQFPGSLKSTPQFQVEFGRNGHLIVGALSVIGVSLKNVTIWAQSNDPTIVDVLNPLVVTDIGGADFTLSGRRIGNTQIELRAVSSPPSTWISQTVQVFVIAAYE